MNSNRMIFWLPSSVTFSALVAGAQVQSMNIFILDSFFFERVLVFTLLPRILVNDQVCQPALMRLIPFMLLSQ
jgi:hypothetical protein